MVLVGWLVLVWVWAVSRAFFFIVRDNETSEVGGGKVRLRRLRGRQAPMHMWNWRP